MARPSKPHLAGGYWRCRIDGKTHHLGKSERQAFSRFYKLMGQRLATPNGTPETIAGLVAKWLALYPKDSHRWRLRPLVAECGGEYLSDLDPDILTRYLRHLESKGYADETIKNYMDSARRVLKWAAHPKRRYVDYVPDRPSDMPKPVEKDRDLSSEIAAAVFAALPMRAARILRFIVECGCRPGEACKLEWRHVHLDRGTCVMSTHKTSKKTGKPRVIYLTEASEAVLKGMRLSIGPVFLNRFGRAYQSGGLRTILRHAAERAAKNAEATGTPDAKRLADVIRDAGNVTPYRLRHTYAQAALDDGESLEVVAKLLGNTIRSAQRYARVRDKRAVAAARKRGATIKFPAAASA